MYGDSNCMLYGLMHTVRLYILTSWTMPQTLIIKPQSDNFGPQIFMVIG